MELKEIKLRAEDSLGSEAFNVCISWSLAAIFSASGYGWPYFFIAESLRSLGRKTLAKSFYHLYTLRVNDNDPEEWINTAEGLMNE